MVSVSPYAVAYDKVNTSNISAVFCNKGPEVVKWLRTRRMRTLARAWYKQKYACVMKYKVIGTCRVERISRDFR